MEERSLISDVDGLSTYLIYDEEGDKAHLHYEQNVSSILADAKGMRETNSPWVSRDKWAGRYARIPAIVQMEMKAKWGVSVYNKDHWPKIVSLIETEYPHLKTSNYSIGKVKR